MTEQPKQPTLAPKDGTHSTNPAGAFVRTESGYREIISATHPVYQPASGRYHLYISHACPWATRCLMVLRLKGLDACIGVTIVHPIWQRTRPQNENDTHCGWAFADETTPLPTSAGNRLYAVKESHLDPINNAAFVRDLYEMCGDKIGKYSVPILWDKNTKTIVNNESSEIVRMFTKEFDEWATGEFAQLDLYPEALRKEIDEVNEWVYSGINNGVYRCGFAKSQVVSVCAFVCVNVCLRFFFKGLGFQWRVLNLFLLSSSSSSSKKKEAYDVAVSELFAALDRAESTLSKHRFLVGDTLTEADVRLFQTLVRFDEVYVVYFKCNMRRIVEYPNILNYCRDIYQLPRVSECVNMDHIRIHYYT